MKTRYVVLLLFLLISTNSYAQYIDLKGTVYVGTDKVSKPIEGIAISVEGIKTDVIYTNHAGYFILRVPFDKAKDKNLLLVFRAGRNIIKKKSIYISRSAVTDDGDFHRELGYRLTYRVGKVLIEQNPYDIERQIIDYDSKYDANYSGLKGEAASSPVSLFSYLLWLIAAPLAPQEPIITRTEESIITPDQISDNNQFYTAGYKFRTANHPGFGFRYSPINIEDITLVNNASAAALKPGFVFNARPPAFITSDYPHLNDINLDVSGQYTGPGGYLFGLSYLLNSYNFNFEALYDDNKTIDDKKRLTEQSLIPAFGYRITNNLSVSLSSRITWMTDYTPSHILRTDYYGYYDTPDNEVLIKSEDDFILHKNKMFYTSFDVSMTAEIFNNLRFGISTIDILSINFSDEATKPEYGAGMGLTVKWPWFYTAADLQIYQNGRFNWSTGISVPFFNYFNLSVGYLNKRNTYKANLRWRTLVFSYTHSIDSWQITTGIVFVRQSDSK